MAHTHVMQGTTDGCRACESIRPESQVHPRLVPPLPVMYRSGTSEPEEEDDVDPEVPDIVQSKPDGQHRIQNGIAICVGGLEHRCHWYPSCDCEAWPCGHEYEYHDGCWVLTWLNATPFADTNDDWSARDDDGNWPDGVIEYEWLSSDDGVTWSYVSVDPPAVQSTPTIDGRRESDVPLWD